MSWQTPQYFDVEALETEKTEKKTYIPPVFIPADAEIQTDSATSPPIIPKERQASPWMWHWLWGSIFIFALLALGMDTYLFIVKQLQQSIFMGVVFVGLLVVILTLILRLTWRSWQQFRRLKAVAVLQETGEKLRCSQNYGNAPTYLNQISEFYQHYPNFQQRLAQFHQTIQDDHTDGEVCRLFSEQLLHPIDQQAYQIIVKRSKEAALLVMISRVALLDTVLTLWRNMRLIRDIAYLYGVRPTFLNTMVLMRRVLESLVYANVSEMMSDSVTEILGGSVLSAVSWQITQGLGNGVMTARIGLYAMQACRPLPFSEEEKPRLKHIRSEVIKTLRTTFTGQPSST